MKLRTLKIKNFRCCKDVELKIGSMHALVGSNNAGKSTILHALDFLFNPSTSKISEEVFWHKDTSLEIRVEALFVDLTDSEKSAMQALLRPDQTFLFARTARLGSGDSEQNDENEKTGIEQHYCKPQPKYEWLIENNISAKNITEWWKIKEQLLLHGKSFCDGFSSKPTVEVWKEKATEFCASVLKETDFEDLWMRNPKGLPNVLKANLPHFELIPAVRDASDESKVLKTNPFGRLISEIVKNLESSLKEDIGNRLKETMKRLNREGGDHRITHITEIENSMKGFLSEVMPADLEIEFQAPTIETLLTTPRIFIDDGFRGAIEGKGHGLQRAVIFSILRSYAKLVTTRSEADKRTMILAVEEPELYMHPTAQRTIRNVLRTISDVNDQVLFTTHSPLLVDVTYFDEIIRVEIPKAEEGEKHCAVVNQLTMESMIEDLVIRNPALKNKVSPDSIREKYSNAYTSSRNEGFFAQKVLLVEGLTEVYSLPIYGRSLGHEFDSMGLAVIDCGGKNQIDRLYRIFNELGIPCYVLFDYDIDNADSDIKRASVELLNFLGQSVDLPTTSMIHAKYSFFKSKWEVDLNPEIPDYEKHAGDAKKFLGKCGKALKARFVANKLASQKPPFVPPTVKAIIEHAVNIKYGGTCLSRKSPQTA